MGKKYTPSGYQIISIDVSAKTSGTAFTPETEDEKLLHEILSSGEIKKPILLKLFGIADTVLVGFPFIIENKLSLTYGAVGTSVTEEIGVSTTKLLWTETKE